MSHGFAHGIENGSSCVAREAGKTRIPENASLYEIHDIKAHANDAQVLAQAADQRHGDLALSKRGQDAVLALDLVRFGRQTAERFATQDERSVSPQQFVGGIRLSAGEPFKRWPP